MAGHTYTSDVETLIDYIEYVGGTPPAIVTDAILRLETAIDEGLQDYNVLPKRTQDFLNLRDSSEPHEE